MQRLVAILCSTHAILSIRGKQRAHSHAFIRSGHIQYTHSAEKRFPVFPSHFFFSSPLSESCQCHQYPFASLYSLNRRAREEGKRGIGWVPPPPPTSLGRRGAAAAAATNAKRGRKHTQKSGGRRRRSLLSHSLPSPPSFLPILRKSLLVPFLRSFRQWKHSSPSFLGSSHSSPSLPPFSAATAGSPSLFSPKGKWRRQTPFEHRRGRAPLPPALEGIIGRWHFFGNPADGRRRSCPGGLSVSLTTRSRQHALETVDK